MADTEPEKTDAPADGLGEKGLRALEAERRARREAERALRDAQEQVAAHERAELAREVAFSSGLDARWADRLQGSTREELEADAEQLGSLVGGSRAAPPGSRPTERLSGGGDPTVDVEPSAGQLADEILS